MTILLTGGQGTLGTELQKLIHCYAPKSYLFDITKENPNVDQFDLIVHCAAYTDLLKAEKEEKDKCYKTNVIGTRNLAMTGVPMIYLSTEYVFNGEKGDYNENDMLDPVNFYSHTKLLGEYEARHYTRCVCVRTLFKPNPYPHPTVTVDQYTSGEYVETIAPEIVKVIKLFKLMKNKFPEVLHIGGRRKSNFDLARQTIQPKTITVQTIKDETGLQLPKDTSLDSTLWRSIKQENGL